MSNLQSYFNTNAFGFWLVLLAAVVVLAGWMAWFQISSRRARAHYDAVLSAIDSGNVPAMLAEYLTTVRRVAEQTADMDARVATLSEVFPSVIRHVGLVRFSPFHDTGGDQSFSLALLDGQGNGIVLSALHSRADHRLYAKPVVGRESSYPLTTEERKAIDRSIEIGVGEAAAS